MNDKKLTLSRWIQRANGDLDACELLLTSKTIAPEIICFHAQQCAEKYLKVYLVFIEKIFPKTHDLLQLLKLCSQHDPSFSSLENFAVQLTDFAILTRYADVWQEITREQAIQSVGYGKKICLFVQSKIKI